MPVAHLLPGQAWEMRLRRRPRAGRGRRRCPRRSSFPWYSACSRHCSWWSQGQVWSR